MLAEVEAAVEEVKGVEVEVVSNAMKSCFTEKVLE